MAVEAIARVMRTGSDASRMLDGLSESAQEALRRLQLVNPSVEASARAWQNLHAQMQREGQLGPPQMAQYTAMGAALRRAAEDAARLPSIDRGRMTGLGYTDAELDRSSQLRPGTVLIPEPPVAKGAGESRFIPGGLPQGAGAGRALPPGRAAVSTAEEATETAKAVRGQADAYADLEKAQRRLTDRQLRVEWRANQVELRAQDRDIDTTVRSIDRLAVQQRRHPRDILVQENLGAARDKLRDLHEGRDALAMQQRALLNEVRNRGMTPAGDYLQGGGAGGGGGGGFVGGLSAFVGGAGIGGGSMQTALAGLAGAISPSRALLALAGMAVGRGMGAASRTFGARVGAYRETFPLEMQAGEAGNAQAGVNAAREGAMELGYFLPSELIQVRRDLARSTGAVVDVVRKIAPLALLTGQTLQEAAGPLALSARVGTGVTDPRLLLQTLESFGGSVFAPRNPSAPFGADTLMLGAFNQSVGQIAGTGHSPLTRMPLEGVAAQLAAMAGVPTPGVEPGSMAHLGIATARMQSLNQFTAGMANQGGGVGDIAYMAVRRLKQNPGLLKRLQAIDPTLNFNTPLGIQRLANRAPELAARGIPEIAEAMHGTFAEMFPDLGLRELVALNAAGGDTEQAAFLARGPRGVYRATAPNLPPGYDQHLLDAAKNIAGGSPVVGAIREGAVRGQALELTGDAMTDMGQAMAKGWNNANEILRTNFEGLSKSLLDLVNELWNREAQGGGAP